MPSFHTDHWDRVFDACEAVDLPLCLHFGSSGFVPSFGTLAAPDVSQVMDGSAPPEAPFVVSIALFATNLLDKYYYFNGLSIFSPYGFATVLPQEPRMFGLSVRKAFGQE